MGFKAKLKDLTLKIGSGSTPRGGQASYLEDGEIHLIRSQNIYNHQFEWNGIAYISEEQAGKLKNVIVEENDILINITGDSVARNMIANNEFLPARVNQHVSIIRCKHEKLDPYYLSAVLTSEKMQRQLLSLGQTGGTRAALTKNMLENLEIPIFDIRKQRPIGQILNMFNCKIANNNKTVDSLEQLTQTLFKHWFVDFEFPNENGEPYKSSGGEMVESQLGMIPKGWSLTRLDEIIVHSKKSFNPKKENVVNVAHFSLPSFDQQEYPLIENSGGIKSNKYYIDNNSVMFSKMNPSTPRVWLPNIIDGIKNICSTEFVVLDTSLQDNKSFIYSLTSSLGFTNYLINNATGSTNSRQRVIPTTAIAYKLPYKEDIATKYEIFVQPMFKKLLQLRDENQRLILLRDTLLPKLLSGEIELPDEIEVTDDVPIPRR